MNELAALSASVRVPMMHQIVSQQTMNLTGIRQMMSWHVPGGLCGEHHHRAMVHVIWCVRVRVSVPVSVLVRVPVKMNVMVPETTRGMTLEMTHETTPEIEHQSHYLNRSS